VTNSSIYSYKKKTKNGFEQETHLYQTQNCEGCYLRSLCHKAKDNQTIEGTYNLIWLKSKARNVKMGLTTLGHNLKKYSLAI